MKYIKCICLMLFMVVSIGLCGGVIGDSKKSDVFIVSRIGERYLLTMPRDMLGREFLVVSRIDDVADNGAYQVGMKAAEDKVIVFREGKEGVVGVHLFNYRIGKKNTAPEMLKLLEKTQQDIALFYCEIQENGRYHIAFDITDMIEGNGVFPEESCKSIINVVSGNRQFGFTTLREFPKTYSRWKQQDVERTTMPVTSMFFLLREEPWEGRLADSRIGYAEVSYTCFPSISRGIRTVHVIKRWPLEPEDSTSYFAGELTNPKHPIVFYLDPKIPEKWKSCFVQAVEDWQKAFEKAGFKEAVVAQELEEGMNMSAASGVIRYHDSLCMSAVDVCVDPRSGEIIQACVNWSPEVLDSVKSEWLDRSCISDLDRIFWEKEVVRATVGRRVGKALGLSDNLLSGRYVPIGRLRSGEQLSTSIMSDLIVNTVAQMDDKVEVEDMFAKVGVYDCWAIDWGYRCWEGSDSEIKKKAFWRANVVRDSLWWYGKEGEKGLCAMADVNCLGDNPIEATRATWNNLKHTFSKKEIKDTVLSDVLVSKDGLLFQSLLPVLQQVGGMSYCLDKNNAPSAVPVEASVQQKAVKFLNDEVFSSLDWIPEKGCDGRRALLLRENVLRYLLTEASVRLGRNVSTADGDGYFLADLLKDLFAGTWGTLTKNDEDDMELHQWRLRYVQVLKSILQETRQIDLRVYLRMHIRHIEDAVKQVVMRIGKLENDEKLKEYMREINEVLY